MHQDAAKLTGGEREAAERHRFQDHTYGFLNIPSAMRQDVAKLSGGEREAAERQLKKRTLGITRLIAELYKKSVVKEPVVHVCISELLGSPNEKPLEDSIEVSAKP